MVSVAEPGRDDAENQKLSEIVEVGLGSVADHGVAGTDGPMQRAGFAGQSHRSIQQHETQRFPARIGGLHMSEAEDFRGLRVSVGQTGEDGFAPGFIGVRFCRGRLAGPGLLDLAGFRIAHHLPGAAVRVLLDAPGEVERVRCARPAAGRQWLRRPAPIPGQRRPRVLRRCRRIGSVAAARAGTASRRSAHRVRRPPRWCEVDSRYNSSVCSLIRGRTVQHRVRTGTGGCRRSLL